MFDVDQLGGTILVFVKSGLISFLALYAASALTACFRSMVSKPAAVANSFGPLLGILLSIGYSSMSISHSSIFAITVLLPHIVAYGPFIHFTQSCNDGCIASVVATLTNLPSVKFGCSPLRCM